MSRLIAIALALLVAACAQNDPNVEQHLWVTQHGMVRVAVWPREGYFEVAAIPEGWTSWDQPMSQRVARIDAAKRYMGMSHCLGKVPRMTDEIEGNNINIMRFVCENAE